jgi:hypothetical protein
LINEEGTQAMAPSPDPSTSDHLPALLGGHHASSAPPAVAASPEPGGAPDQLDPLTSRRSFDALVDAVIERIERRVIDELERRGRAQMWGGF